MSRVVRHVAIAMTCSALGGAFAACALFASPGSYPPDGGAGDAGGTDAADASDPNTAYGAVVLADHPVAYYRFDEAAIAIVAADSAGTHPAKADTAGVTFGAPGVRGGGATFDGTAVLVVGDAFDFAGKQPFTVEFWVRFASAQPDVELIRKRDDTVSPFQGWILYTANGSPHFEAWGADLSATSPEVLGPTFKHVVVTVDYSTGMGNARMYVNASPSSTGGANNVRDLPDTPAPLLFGRGLVGVMDEIALYDKALPPDRIVAHYNAGR